MKEINYKIHIIIMSIYFSFNQKIKYNFLTYIALQIPLLTFY